jgi:hypothetical protein
MRTARKDVPAEPATWPLSLERKNKSAGGLDRPTFGTVNANILIYSDLKLFATDVASETLWLTCNVVFQGSTTDQSREAGHHHQSGLGDEHD